VATATGFKRIVFSIVAIGNPEQQACKALHYGSKQQ